MRRSRSFVADFTLGGATASPSAGVPATEGMDTEPPSLDEVTERQDHRLCFSQVRVCATMPVRR